MCWYFQSLLLCTYSYHPNAICSIKARYSYTAKDSIQTIADLNRWTRWRPRAFSRARWKRLWRCSGFLRLFFLFLFFPSFMRDAKYQYVVRWSNWIHSEVQMETPRLLIWKIDGKQSSGKPGNQRGMSKKIKTKKKTKEKERGWDQHQEGYRITQEIDRWHNAHHAQTVSCRLLMTTVPTAHLVNK